MKTENFSTACETATLKSPPPRAFSESDVQQRLRKHLSRCTLDCGFKTSESPALRGFVDGLRALATVALYLVLLSNGLHRPKIWLKKFGFSLKSLPRIAQKSCRCNAVPNRFSSRFSTSRTNGPRLLLWAKVGTHSASPTRSHTRAHTAKQVVFWVGVVSLPSDRFARFGNPAWPGIRTANFAAFGPWLGVL